MTSTRDLNDHTRGGVYAVVMAGGSGTRFWPLSRRATPKQFLSIGQDAPLITATLSRLARVSPPDQHYVVAGSSHVSGVREHCPTLPHDQLLIEPCARNTAPCVALAALHVAERDPDGVMIISPADHHIADPIGFERALQSAVEGARRGQIVTLGVVPTRPETGYGYIRSIERGTSNETRLKVDRFVEKPPRRVAESYLESGDYLWNSGLFITSARRIWREFESQLPETARALGPVRDALRAGDQELYQSALDQAFMEIKPISVDVGVMEGARGVEVVPLDVGWSDVGHWGALEEVSPPDERGCVTQGSASHLLLDAERVTVSSDKLVAALGVSDLIIVDTPDATLVCHRERAQDVRRIVEALTERGRDELI